MIDIYSRYIVGAYVHAQGSGELAVEMMKEIFGIHGIPQIVHADRGTSMTSKQSPRCSRTWRSPDPIPSRGSATIILAAARTKTPE